MLLILILYHDSNIITFPDFLRLELIKSKYLKNFKNILAKMYNRKDTNTFTFLFQFQQFVSLINIINRNYFDYF